MGRVRWVYARERCTFIDFFSLNTQLRSNAYNSLWLMATKSFRVMAYLSAARRGCRIGVSEVMEETWKLPGYASGLRCFRFAQKNS